MVEKKSKKAGTKAAKGETAPVAAETKAERYGFTLEQGDETKSYAKFVAPKDSGCVGTLYAPKGTKTVKVLIIGGDGEE